MAVTTSAVSVAKGLLEKRRSPKPKIEVPGGFVALVALVGALDIVGLAMVLSASSVHDLRVYHSAWYSFAHQLVYVVAGAGAMVAAIRLDYRRWRRWASPLLGACLVMLFFVLVPGVGVRVSGSARWLGAGPVQFQPSEITKLALTLFCADILCRRAKWVGDGFYAVMPVLAAFGVVGLLVMAQPDMGTTLVLASIILGILFVGGVPIVSMGLLLAVGAAGAFILG
ncbi:MAG: cell division protein FtsW, partial [Acidimicrobiaceae bacterium]|nr:cell division protein FtsW [Acidimicrobiaceae bacterium]